jgi:Flp pilus assembly secretin CpaC
VRETPPADLVDIAQRGRARSRAPWVANDGSAPDRSGPTATLARPSSRGRTLIVPAGDGPGVQTALAVGRVPLPGSSPDEPRLINGSRPKVDVGRPPVAVQRGIQLSDTADQARQPLPVDAAAKSIPEPAVTASLRFKPTEVRALKIENTIQRVEVQSAAVCAAVKTGPNQLQLIAIGNGVTKVNLWTLDSTGQQQRELYEIQVAEVPTAQTDELENIAATLTRSVRSAFPNSRVQVRYSSGRLVATGTCQDEESARRMLRMIRSACQMPVDDKVSVR